jgi:elongation factor G
MKIYQTDQIRNISVLGNSGSGKTTLSESMLFLGGVIDRRGDVESGNTVSDYADIEHENQISVFSTPLYTEWKDCKINFIDTPGMDDFSGGIISSMRVTDAGLMLLNAQNGIEVGTEIIGRHAAKHNKPLIYAINQLDHDKSNYERTIEQVKERYGQKFVSMQYPVHTGSGFYEIIDLLKKVLLKYPAEGGKAQVEPVPTSEQPKAEELRNQLIEAAAENDEQLMEQFFEKGTLDEAQIMKGIKIGLLQRHIFPAFCISAKRNIGCDRLMDFICDIVPSPAETAIPENSEGQKVKCDPAGITTLFVFKTSVEPHIGEINYFKVMAGGINESADLTNLNTSNKERLSQLFVVAGKKREKVPKLIAGDFGATVKLKNTKFNHTLCANNQAAAFNPVIFPDPKYRTAVKTKTEGEEEKLADALNRITLEDPTIIVEYSKELKQILLHGQGEYHLNIVKWHLDKIFKIDVDFISPKIPYRETITKIAQSSYRHKKQSGGAGQFGEVHMIIEPYVEGMPDPVKYKVEGKDINISVRGKEEIDLQWGGKLIYFNCIVGGSIDARFMPAILKGVMEKMEEGPLTGSYARDIRIAVYDGKMHTVDSNDISFRLAGRNAFKQAFKIAGPKILEPIYSVEVLVPSDSMGDVMNDLQGRRAMIEGMNSESGFEKIIAKVPLSEMNKYSTALSSLTSGRATYTMKFARYEQVPGEIQDKLLKAYEAEAKEEE